MGHIWTIWRGKGGNQVNVYTVRGENDSAATPENFVRQVRVTSSAFHTSSGLKVGASLAAVTRIDRHLRLAKQVGDRKLMDDVRSGITYDFSRSMNTAGGWRCIGILIHPRNVGVLQEYLPFPGYS